DNTRPGSARCANSAAGQERCFGRGGRRKGRVLSRRIAGMDGPEPVPDEWQAQSVPPLAPSAPATPASRLSIVVLPFTNLSNDPEQQYFADGITSDLTTDLSRIPDMLVISRNTAFTYRSKPVDTKQIGRELRVHYVLEGEVQRLRDRLRATPPLVAP